MKTVLITGSSGFIGGHLTKHLKNKDYFVIGADIEFPKYEKPDKFYKFDLRNQVLVEQIFKNHPKIDEVYNLACLMGGMGYIGDTKHSYDIMVGSSQIVSNILEYSTNFGVKKHFYSSSACCYNMTKQDSFNAKPLKESDAYPLQCDLIYGFQKAFSEQMYEAAYLSNGLDIRILRFFNIFGEEGVYDGGKEKAPAALARKVAMAKNGESIEVWGTGEAQRTFLYISECISGIEKVMNSSYNKPLNLGSTELVTINELARMIINISGKDLTIKNIDGNVGVASRNTDNSELEKVLNWSPSQPLRVGIEKLYKWVENEVNKKGAI